MSAYRPQESVSVFNLSSSSPVGDVGKATLFLNGAMGAVYETTAASSGTGTLQVQFREGGDWHPWPCYEYASGAGTYTRRAAGVTITLADDDILFILTPGCYAVRFSLAGTSATVYGRTCEDIDSAILDQLTTDSVLTASKGKQFTTITSSTSETTIVTAGAAGLFRDVYMLVIANTSASACNVTIKDATAGSTVDVIAVPAGETRGWTVPADSAIPQAAAANNWTATCSASVASINIGASYVTR